MSEIDDDIIDSKSHANRAKDREALPELRELLERISKNTKPGEQE